MKIKTLILFLFLFNHTNGYITTKDNRLYNDRGAEVLFHGVNVVCKGYPWIPNTDVYDPRDSFTEKDVNYLVEWGFNAIRLGVMWPGLEPHKSVYNHTYLKKLEYIVNLCDKANIHVILDFHQDVLSNRFCGEGVPDWLEFSENDTHKFPYPIDKDFVFKNGFPTKESCAKHNWVYYQFTQAASRAYQDLYDNVNGIKDRFIMFWKKIAETFKKYNNIIGYELFNEPWAGDIFKHPSLILPKVADKHNLEKFYNDIAYNIRKIDNRTAIMFESVTWDIDGIGFDHAILGETNKSILSYHTYFPPNIDIDIAFKTRMRDMRRLGIGGILTEFDYGSGSSDKKTLDFGLKLIDSADVYIQSWLIWDYKMFYSLTGSNKGFFNNDNSLTNAYYTFSRPYPMQIEGTIDKVYFNNDTKAFSVVFTPNYTINSFSKLYVNKNLHYPKNYNVNILPKYSLTMRYYGNYIYAFLNESMETEKINILIRPNH